MKFYARGKESKDKYNLFFNLKKGHNSMEEVDIYENYSN